MQTSQAAGADPSASGGWEPLAAERFLDAGKTEGVARDRHVNGLPTTAHLCAAQSEMLRGLRQSP